jgi:proteic killer suppression protein
MIVTFVDREAKKIFDGAHSRRYTALESIIERKLRALHRAMDLGDLVNPPGNRLEALKGDRLGQYSIRVNNQFRICFRWEERNAFEVEIVDYH